MSHTTTPHYYLTLLPHTYAPHYYLTLLSQPLCHPLLSRPMPHRPILPFHTTLLAIPHTP